MRKGVRTMVKPVIRMGVKLGKPRVPDEHSKRSERLDGKVREGENVADYQRRVMSQIEGLDWGSAETEPEL